MAGHSAGRPPIVDTFVNPLRSDGPVRAAIGRGRYPPAIDAISSRSLSGNLVSARLIRSSLSDLEDPSKTSGDVSSAEAIRSRVAKSGSRLL